MKNFIWPLWIVLCLALGSYFLYKLQFSEDKSEFLIGETTYGHYQIEMSCESCHTDPFGGQEILQNACLNCHEQELNVALDSHPKKKFTDPRNADRIEKIDARYCVSCHTEHHQERTLSMGLTLPDDYCFHCHSEIGEDRESHKDLPYDSCASAGCHNYHDNRALYEDFLVKNSGQPWLHEIATIKPKSYAKNVAIKYVSDQPDIFPEKLSQHPTIVEDWQASSHAEAGVSCGGCHSDNSNVWIDKPNLAQCKTCHETETETFTSGKHGMRLSARVAGVIDAVMPSESHLQFKESALGVQHGCNACHSSHSFNTEVASVDSCLTCHDDQHSNAFLNSPHAKLQEKNKNNDGSVVTCATCHMPRIEKKTAGKSLHYVDHNQNYNLRPNEKMIRPVCMNCHGLEFSINSLADPKLIKNNFNGKPGIHIESVDWATKRLED